MIASRDAVLRLGMRGWCHAAKRNSTAPRCCSGLWSVWGEAPMQPAVFSVVLLTSRITSYTNGSQSLTSCSYLQKCGGQVLGKAEGKGQTAQRKQNRCMPSVPLSEQSEGSGGHAKPYILCLKVSAPCLQRTELWAADGGVGGSVLILGAWGMHDLLPVCPGAPTEEVCEQGLDLQHGQWPSLV